MFELDTVCHRQLQALVGFETMSQFLESRHIGGAGSGQVGLALK